MASAPARLAGALAALGAVAAAHLGAAELPTGEPFELLAPWSNWAWSRQVEAPSVSPEGLAAAPVPAEVWARARQDLGDLRLIDAAGTEAGWVLHAPVGERRMDWRRADLRDTGHRRGAWSQAVADTGGGALHDAARIEVVEDDFFARVEVAASEDGEGWRVLRREAPLYRLEGGRRDLVIRYPRTDDRWLRLRILEAERDLTVRAVEVALAVEREAVLETLPAALQPAAESAPGETVWVGGSVAALPASRVRFADPGGLFHRPVEVAAEVDGRWRAVGTGEIFRRRAPDAGSGAEGREEGSAPPEGDAVRLAVEFPETRAARWRVTVTDGGDPPLPGLAPELLGTPRRVVFRAEPGFSGRLLYGNPEAEMPAYQVARLTDEDERRAAAPAPLGPPRPNPGWRDPSPWSERHPWVLWAALGLAVAVLGGAAWRVVRSG